MPGPITIMDKGLAEKDSDESLVYVFDFDGANLPDGVELVSSGTVVITPIESPAVLIDDNQSLLAGNRKVQVRLAGGTIGTRYRVALRVTTNESPNQIKEKYFLLHIKS